MRQSRKKHAVLILLLLLIALVSVGITGWNPRLCIRSSGEIRCLVQRTDVSRRTEKADKRRKEK